MEWDAHLLTYFNPRVHMLAADRAFLSDGRFVTLPAVPRSMLVEGFRRTGLEFLVNNDALSEGLRSRMLGWRHCGFSAHNEVKRTGIDDFCWHDLRHTWASWHVQNGTLLYVLQELGG